MCRHIHFMMSRILLLSSSPRMLPEGASACASWVPGTSWVHPGWEMIPRNRSWTEINGLMIMAIFISWAAPSFRLQERRIRHLRLLLLLFERQIRSCGKISHDGAVAALGNAEINLGSAAEVLNLCKTSPAKGAADAEQIDKTRTTQTLAARA